MAMAPAPISEHPKMTVERMNGIASPPTGETSRYMDNGWAAGRRWFYRAREMWRTLTTGKMAIVEVVLT
jgi:hypothetical protein